MRTLRTVGAAIAVGTALLLSGCLAIEGDEPPAPCGAVTAEGGCAPPSPDEGVESTIRLLGSWSQAYPEGEWVGDVMPVGTVVIRTDAERDDWMASLPAGVAEDDATVDAVRDVDLDEALLVVGGYYRCTESSTVSVVDGEPEFEVLPGDDRTNCAWSPAVIDVWRVPLEVL